MPLTFVEVNALGVNLPSQASIDFCKSKFFNEKNYHGLFVEDFDDYFCDGEWVVVNRSCFDDEVAVSVMVDAGK